MMSVETLYNSSKYINDAKVSSYVERFMKELLSATKRGIYQTKLLIYDEDIDYEMSETPHPYVFTSIDIIKEKYAGIKVETCMEDGYITHFTVSWDLDVTNKYKQSINTIDIKESDIMESKAHNVKDDPMKRYSLPCVYNDDQIQAENHLENERLEDLVEQARLVDHLADVIKETSISE